MSVEILHNLPDNGRFKLPDDKCETLHGMYDIPCVRIYTARLFFWLHWKIYLQYVDCVFESSGMLIVYVAELEASFSIRLFPKCFSIGKPLEVYVWVCETWIPYHPHRICKLFKNNGFFLQKKRGLPPIHEAMDRLYPYNRTSESFLRVSIY